MRTENRLGASLKTDWVEVRIGETFTGHRLPGATTSPFSTTRPLRQQLENSANEQ